MRPETVAQMKEFLIEHAGIPTIDVDAVLQVMA
jgi:hypothetical protein